MLSVFQYVPAKQVVHCIAPSDDMSPGLHTSHFKLLFVTLPVMYVPAMQRQFVLKPFALEYVGHCMHDEEPLYAEYLPSGHEVQVIASPVKSL